MAKLTVEQLKKLNTERLMALFKTVRTKHFKIVDLGMDDDEEIGVYHRQIKKILDSRENLEKNNGKTV